MKLFKYALFSLSIGTFYSTYSAHNPYRLLGVGSASLVKEGICLLPDTFGSNLGALVGYAYDGICRNDRQRACLSIVDLALGFSVSCMLSNLAFSIGTGTFNYICGSSCDEEFEKNSGTEIGRLFISTGLATLFWVRSIYSYLKRDEYGCPPFSMSYTAEQIFEMNMNLKEGEKKAEIQQFFLLSPFVREPKKYELYKGAYSSIHHYVSDDLVPDSLYHALSKKSYAHSGKVLLMQIAVNHALLRTSLSCGRKNGFDQNGIVVRRGYQGLPGEVINQVIEYLGHAPFC